MILKMDNLEKKLEEKQNNQQESYSDFETLEKRLEKIDKLIEEKNRRIEVFEEKIRFVEVKQVEKSKINHDKSSIVCKFCSFEAKSVAGLKVHMKRKHTFKDIETYPTNCEICKEMIENGLKMKRHMKTHSYICATYKCLDCNLICDNLILKSPSVCLSVIPLKFSSTVLYNSVSARASVPKR